MKKILLGLTISVLFLLLGVSGAWGVWIETFPGALRIKEITSPGTADSGYVNVFATNDTVGIVDESGNTKYIGAAADITNLQTTMATVEASMAKVEAIADLDDGLVDGMVFHVNIFQYPVPATEWKPQLEGAGLPDAQAAKKCWIPLNFLKAGDKIVSYSLVGDVVETDTVTVDAQIYSVDKADPITTTAIAGGGMTQVDADGNFDVLTTLSSVETVVTDKQYSIEIIGTTTASDAITVMGAEVTINRRL